MGGEVVPVALILLVTVVVAVVVVVAVQVRPGLRLIEPDSLGEYALFIGPLEPVIVVSTVLTSTKQSLRSTFLCPTNPQTILPTFSRLQGWPLTMARS